MLTYAVSFKCVKGTEINVCYKAGISIFSQNIKLLCTTFFLQLVPEIFNQITRPLNFANHTTALSFHNESITRLTRSLEPSIVNRIHKMIVLRIS